MEDEEEEEEDDDDDDDDDIDVSCPHRVLARLRDQPSSIDDQDLMRRAAHGLSPLGFIDTANDRTTGKEEPVTRTCWSRTDGSSNSIRDHRVPRETPNV